jgi:hypothetical protein
MPIRPSFKWLYPIDWPQLSAVIRFERARGRCERCGRPHGREIRHLGDGRWWDEEQRAWRNGRGRTLRLARADIAVRTTRVALIAAPRGGTQKILFQPAASYTLVESLFPTKYPRVNPRRPVNT